MRTRIDEYRKRPTGELLVELEEKRRECFNIRFQQASERASDPQLLRALRKDVARIKTVIREREIAGEE